MMKRYPGITTMSGGRKRVRVRATDQRTGREREREKIIEGTIEDALKLQATMREEIHQSDHVAKQPPRLRDYVESWLKSKTLRVKTSTAMVYADTLAHYVLPHFGDWFIGKIGDGDVREWQAQLAKDLAGATVNGALVMLRMVMADAVVEYELPRNPVERVRRLPVRKFTDEEPNLLAAEELPEVLAAFREHMPEHYPLAATLVLTGLRYGEGTAMKWGDIDWETGNIHIRRRVYRYIVDTPKTSGSIRNVPLVPELAAILKSHRAKLQAQGHSVDADAWVFPGKDGLLPPCSLRHPMERALRLAGIHKRVERSRYAAGCGGPRAWHCPGAAVGWHRRLNRASRV